MIPHKDDLCPWEPTLIAVPVVEIEAHYGRTGLNPYELWLIAQPLLQVSRDIKRICYEQTN